MKDYQFIALSECALANTNLIDECSKDKPTLATNNSNFSLNTRNAHVTISFSELQELNFLPKLIKRKK